MEYIFTTSNRWKHYCKIFLICIVRNVYYCTTTNAYTVQHDFSLFCIVFQILNIAISFFFSYEKAQIIELFWIPDSVIHKTFARNNNKENHTETKRQTQPRRRQTHQLR